MRKITFLISFFVVLNYSFSQNLENKITKFSFESEIYLQELDEFINSSKNKDLAKVISEFKNNIQTQKFSTACIKQIIEISNTMLANRLRVNPHFSYFFNAINSFSSQENVLNKFSNWLNISNELLERSTTKRLMHFFVFTADFLSTGALRNSRAIKWYCSSMDYTFEVSLGHPYINFDKEVTLSCSSQGSTINIYKVKGKFWPFNYNWEGYSGLIDWQKAGFHQDSVYAI
ncbi:uncharacterized protein METZ01_LOCUS457062, partial [marine metagenome]